MDDENRERTTSYKRGGSRHDAMSKKEMLSRAITWVYGVIFQADRMFSAVEEFYEAIKIKDANRTEIACERLELEEHFFCITANKAVEWLTTISKEIPELKQSCRTFINSFPLAEELRHMREHEVEYYKGRGRIQRKLKTGERDIAQHAIFNRKKFKIGNRLNVQEAKAVAKKIYPVLREYLTELDEPCSLGT
jgi:hypothetical protein